MPLVAHSRLPTFERLRREGHDVLEPMRAAAQDIRELHIGLLNLMPDAALEATERQFMRLLGSCNRIAQLYVHPFTVTGVSRDGRARDHVETFYEDFDTLREEGLDAIVVTGANPAQADITREGFWPAMIDIFEWGRENTCSVLCSCLATHAVFHHFHGVQRTPLRHKRWGVYSHVVTEPTHPLVSNVNSRFDAPHSHLNELTRAQMESADARVLALSDVAGPHLAVSADGFRFVFFQGHPEYDAESLLKEYKREVNRFVAGDREDYPPFPENYFDSAARKILELHGQAVRDAAGAGRPAPGFPEERVRPLVHNTWTDTGKAMFNNWLGLVYQLTDVDRRRPFMPGVDPADPLGWRASRAA